MTTISSIDTEVIRTVFNFIFISWKIVDLWSIYDQFVKIKYKYTKLSIQL